MEDLHRTQVDHELREALTACAVRMGLDPTTIGSPSPGVIIARSPDGALLRLDVSTCTATDLGRGGAIPDAYTI